MPGTAGANAGISELILSAGPVAKFVLVLLALFSVICWALIVEKWWEFRRVRSESTRFLRVFREAADGDGGHGGRRSALQRPE